jgi:hypothetical protein
LGGGKMSGGEERWIRGVFGLCISFLYNVCRN